MNLQRIFNIENIITKKLIHHGVHGTTNAVSIDDMFGVWAFIVRNNLINLLRDTYVLVCMN